MIAIIDYGMGNLRSVQKAFEYLGEQAVITDDPAAVAGASHLVLPGVGSFADAMTTMNELGQTQAIKERVAQGAPFLGICLGMQLCLERGDEGCAEGQEMEGLGLMRGRIVRMPALAADGSKFKVPHVGWNSVELAAAGNPLFAGVEDGSYFYFTHSYICECSDAADVAGTTCHAQPFASTLRRGQVFGCQFHPEKSSAAGMRVLANFGRIVEEAWA